MILPVIYSLILGITHFWNDKIQIRQEFARVRVISFVAGISVTYIFLNLLPEVYKSFEFFDRLIFISLLAGFSTAHLVEKYIYQHSEPLLLREKLGVIHLISFFFYHFFLGVILVKLNKVSSIDSVLFFLPVLFYSAVGITALERIHTKFRGVPIRLLLSLSSLFGVLLADFLLAANTSFSLLFGLVVGAFLYITLMDFVPREAKGRPGYFALGVLVYTLIIVSTFN